MFYIQVVEVLHYVSQKFNSFPFFSLPFPKKAESFSSHFVDFPQKNKNYFLKDKISAKLFPSSSIFHNCAKINLYDCIVFGKKRFHCYVLALNPLFLQNRYCSDELLLNNYDDTITFIVDLTFGITDCLLVIVFRT